MSTLKFGVVSCRLKPTIISLELEDGAIYPADYLNFTRASQTEIIQRRQGRDEIGQMNIMQDGGGGGAA